MPNQPPSVTAPLKNYFFLTAVILISFWSFSYHLGEVPPYHTDEDFYIQSAKTMLETGDYLTPVYHDEKRFAKPIFFYWLVALSYKVFGVNLVSARLFSVIFATLSVGLVYLLGRRLFDRQAALLGAFILPSIYLHFQISRWATTDMTLSFFILLAIWFFVKAWQEEPRRELNCYFFYLAMAFGFLTKGPPAILVPGLTVAAFLLILRDWKMIAGMRLFTGFLILLIVDVPWFAMMYHLHGDEFLNHLLGAEIRDRVFHPTPFSFYYPGVLIRYCLPWSLFFIFSLAVYTGLAEFTSTARRGLGKYFSSLPKNIQNQLFRIVDKDHHALLFCFLWIVVPLLVFTVFRIEHSRYLLPATPAVALILGHFFTGLINSPAGLQRPLFKIPFFLTVSLFLLLTVVCAAGILIFEAIAHAPFRVMFFPLLLGTGSAVLILMFMLKRRMELILMLAVFQTFSLAFIHGDLIPYFNQYPMKKFAHEIAKKGTGEERIGVYHLGSHQARMGILTGQYSKFIFTPEGLRDFSNTDKKVFVVLRETDWQEKFSDLPLTRLSEDRIWKKRRVDKTFLRELRDQGVDFQPAGLFETVYLFTNR